MAEVPETASVLNCDACGLLYLRNHNGYYKINGKTILFTDTDKTTSATGWAVAHADYHYPIDVEVVVLRVGTE